ncbi:MAG: hypothetical protein WCP45_18170 [Verrucomicrobiota bacterium]
MTSTLRYVPATGIDDYFPSHATSYEAQSVGLRISNGLDGTSKVQTPALEELTDTFLDCREEGWDGYGAMPVEDASYLRAQAFLSRLLLRFPAPTASTTPHGSLTLEWISNPRRRMMVSVGCDEQIAYAAVYGDQTVQGVTSFFQDIPQEISDHLSRLYFMRR